MGEVSDMLAKYPCGHAFSNVEIERYIKKGELYLRVLNCEICGSYEDPIDPSKFPSAFIKRLDREGVIAQEPDGALEFLGLE
ncbi:MAG TPA: hypothetical protein VJ485_04455 [archaeon]|jgi:hypothetical protein|nr:hypothetical protein [archaeon]